MNGELLKLLRSVQPDVLATNLIMNQRMTNEGSRIFSYTWYDKMQDRRISDLDQMWLECNAFDWDGYGALPVSSNTIKNVKQVCKHFSPSDHTEMSFTPEPDGGISIEWGFSQSYFSFSVISSSERFPYAFNVGDKSAIGVANDVYEIKLVYLEFLSYVMKASL